MVILIICLVMLLWMMCKFEGEEYQYRRQHDQNNRKNGHETSKPDDSLGRNIHIFGEANIKRDSGTVESHQCGVGWFEMNKLLKLACARSKKELLNLVIISRRLKIGSFFRCHKIKDVAKPPNVQSSGTRG